MSTILEGRVADGEASARIFVRLLRDGGVLAEQRDATEATIVTEDGRSITLDLRDSDVLGAEKVEGRWSELSELPHADAVAKRAPGGHVKVVLERAVLEPGDPVVVAVEAIEESVAGEGYRGDDPQAKLRAKARLIGIGGATRAQLAAKLDPSAASATPPAAAARRWELRRFYLGYLVLAAVAGIGAAVSGSAPLRLASFVAVYTLVSLALLDVSSVHFPPRFRAGDASVIPRDGFFFVASPYRPNQVPFFSLPWLTWRAAAAFVAVELACLPLAIGLAAPLGFEGESERVLVVALGALAIGVAGALLFRSRRFFAGARLLLGAPAAQPGSSHEFASVEGRLRTEQSARRCRSTFGTTQAQQHDGETLTYHSVHHSYSERTSFVVEVVGGEQVSVETGEGALWSTLDRTVHREKNVRRVLTEVVAEGSPVLVAGPYDGETIVGRGVESVVLLGAGPGATSARSALQRSVWALRLPPLLLFAIGIGVAALAAAPELLLALFGAPQ